MAGSRGLAVTDRVHALTVVLDRDIRTDDIEPLLTAISLLRGVASVASVRVDAGDYIARERARTALLTEILKALEPKP